MTLATAKWSECMVNFEAFDEESLVEKKNGLNVKAT